MVHWVDGRIITGVRLMLWVHFLLRLQLRVWHLGIKAKITFVFLKVMPKWLVLAEAGNKFSSSVYIYIYDQTKTGF